MPHLRHPYNISTINSVHPGSRNATAQVRFGVRYLSSVFFFAFTMLGFDSVISCKGAQKTQSESPD